MNQQDGHSLSGQCDRQFVAMPDGPIEAICRDELYDHWRLRSGNEIRTEKQAPEISSGSVCEMLEGVSNADIRRNGPLRNCCVQIYKTDRTEGSWKFVIIV